MPLAVTHILLTIIVVDLFRDYITKHKKYFTMMTLFIAGFAGLLPDIDMALGMIGDLFGFTLPTLLQHGGITHTLIFALVFIIPGLILWKQEKHKAAMMFFVIAFGIFFHILLDFVLGGGMHSGIMWLWPVSTATFKIHLLSKLGMSNVPMALDAVLLLGWLWHEQRKHNIKEYI